MGALASVGTTIGTAGVAGVTVLLGTELVAVAGAVVDAGLVKEKRR